MKVKTFECLKRNRLRVAVALGMLLPMVVSAKDIHVRGVPVTGINELCGSPVFSLPVPAALPPTIRATNVGEYNPVGALPIPLSSTNCSDDIILATTTDEAFLAAAGIPDAADGIKNIPLRKNFVITGQDGSRSMVPSFDQVPGNALPPTKGKPDETITLGKWLHTKGNLSIHCRTNGEATVYASFKKLIPNGVYTMWGVWTTLSGPPIVPVPLGGIPNVLVPDHRGNASFFRRLRSCPMNATEDGSLLMFITLAYHSDNDINGAMPELQALPTTIQPPNGPSFTTTFAPGVATHDAMEFLINGERLN